MRIVYLQMKETKLFTKTPTSYVSRRCKKRVSISFLMVHFRRLMSVVIHSLGPCAAICLSQVCILKKKKKKLLIYVQKQKHYDFNLGSFFKHVDETIVST